MLSFFPLQLEATPLRPVSTPKSKSLPGRRSPTLSTPRVDISTFRLGLSVEPTPVKTKALRPLRLRPSVSRTTPFPER